MNNIKDVWDYLPVINESETSDTGSFVGDEYYSDEEFKNNYSFLNQKKTPSKHYKQMFSQKRMLIANELQEENYIPD